MESDKDEMDIARTILSLLEKESMPWEHARGKSTHRYDLRKLIDEIWVEDKTQTGCTLGMRLRNDSGGSGRPDQVVQALGFSQPARSIHRTKLITGSN